MRFWILEVWYQTLPPVDSFSSYSTAPSELSRKYWCATSFTTHVFRAFASLVFSLTRHYHASDGCCVLFCIWKQMLGNKMEFIKWTCSEVAKVASICTVPCHIWSHVSHVVTLVTCFTCILVQLSEYLHNTILVTFPKGVTIQGNSLYLGGYFYVEDTFQGGTIH